MPIDITAQIAAELNIAPGSVDATIALFKDDATVPFIARYRKEATGGLDEVQISDIRDRLAYYLKLEERKQTILRTIEELGKLTDELKAKIELCMDSVELEDLYLPYKPKRKTRATKAIEQGLEPLADLIWNQEPIEGDIEQIVQGFLDAEKGVETVDQAWAGARDIVAERVSENAEIRADLRTLYLGSGTVASTVKKGKEKEGANFRDYFDYSEPTGKIPSHRMLAVRRGEAEGFLSFRINVDRDLAMAAIRLRTIKGEGGPLVDQLNLACEDSFDRLLSPSIEGFARNELRRVADEEAISVFSKNLRRLLMSPPLGGKWVLAIDPGIRTGCKMVALDDKGDLLANTVIFPMASAQEAKQAEVAIEQYCQRYRIEAIAVGNGTGGRETERFLRKLDPDVINGADVILVNESGASIYSASEVAREEFPDHDLTVRGAISIGRRLQDPLAELVKIDPKSIGVGQYQHDVDQDLLKQSLDDVVVFSVNAVGVELNTASGELLSYVSGLNKSQAKAIVDYRRRKGSFKSRSQLLDVPRLGPKTFEQAAGFLRIRGGDNPLDGSAVHPERYELVQTMAQDLGVDISTLMTDKEARAKIQLEKYISNDVGEPTLRDILDELEKPGRDPRPPLEPVRFHPEISEIEHLRKEMILEGVVTNVTNFGAFIDIGVHQDGLVHVSEISHEFVDDPSKVLGVEQRVKVMVIDVDMDRKRISLSIKAATEPPAHLQRQRQEPESREPRRRPASARPSGTPRKGAPGRGKPQGGGNPMAYNPFAALKLEGGKIKLENEQDEDSDKNNAESAGYTEPTHIDPETGISKNQLKKKKKKKKRK